MVQIIQSGPSAATLRQQALDQALGNIMQGYSAYDANQKQEALTKRQQALQEQAQAREDLKTELAFNQNAAEKGIDISYEDAVAHAQGKYKPKVISPEQPAQYKELAGPVQPGQAPLQGLVQEAKPAVLGPSNPYSTYAESKRLKAEQEAQAKLAELQLKQAQAEDFRETAPLKKQKYQAEIARIQSDAAMSPLKKRALISQIQKNENEAIKSLRESTGPLADKRTDTAKKAAGFSERMIEAEQNIGKLPAGLGTENSAMFTGMGIFPERLKGEQTKLREQAERNFITANLRLESGATIGDNEYQIERAKYFAMPGDTPAVLAQKAQSRQQAIRNLQMQGGLPETGSPQTDSLQASSKEIVKQVKSMSREEKLRILQGGA